jgi:hypothetical protein
MADALRHPDPEGLAMEHDSDSGALEMVAPPSDSDADPGRGLIVHGRFRVIPIAEARLSQEEQSAWDEAVAERAARSR